MRVVFDTNAYRNFVSGKPLCQIQKEITDIVQKEKAHGNIAHMSTTVAMEIISHLKDNEEEFSYKSCIKAVQALYYHCGDENMFRLAPLPETQLAMEFFGVENVKSIKTQTKVGQILYQIAKTPDKKTIGIYDSEIQQVIDFIHNAEKNLIVQVEAMAKAIDPTYYDWTLFRGDLSKRTKYLNEVKSENFFLMTSLAMLTAVCYDLVGQGVELREYTREEIKAHAEAYMQRYAASLELRRYWMLQLPGHFDMTKKSRANFIWDEKILHLIDHTIGGDSILIVTADDKMHECAKKVNPAANIVKLDEYLSTL